MEFVQNFTPPDFQAKNFAPSISPNFNSFSKKKHKNELLFRPIFFGIHEKKITKSVLLNNFDF